MKIKNRKITDLIAAEYNPRELTAEQHQQLKDSLSRFGVVDPVIVNTHPERENIIVGGHQRAKVWSAMGNDTIPTVEVKLTPEKERELNIRLNKNSGQWDEQALQEYFNTDELIEWGFDGEELKFFEPETTEGLIDDDEIPEVTEAITQEGDLWILGEHRLLCGDSTKQEDVERLMDGNKADMVFTDPPYGMKKEKQGVLNDNLNYDDLLNFNKQWIPLSFSILKDVGSWYCWGTDEPLMDIYSDIIKPYIKENKATFRNLITWNKSYLKNGGIFNPFGASGMDGNRLYPIADEKCLFIMMGVQGFNTNADNYFEAWEPIRKYLNDEMEKCGGRKNWKTALDNQMGSHYFTKSQWTLPTEENYKKLQEFANGKAFKKEYSAIKKEYYATRSYFRNSDESNNVWNIELLKGGEEKDSTGGHATPKPLGLCERAVKSSSRKREICSDLFLGSGSTLIACEKTNRKCYGMELDPHYCDVIVKRWEEYTGKKAEKTTEMAHA